MVRTTRRAAAAAALALVAGTISILTGSASPASAVPACAPDGPAPEALAVSAQDVTLNAKSWFRQTISVTIRGGCSDLPAHSCSDDPGACTTLQFAFRRSGTVGPQARACAYREFTEADAVRPTSNPNTFVYDVGFPWSVHALDDTGQPAMTNACAGPWDVVVTPSNETKVNGSYTASKGQTYTQTKAFSLLRGARLGTNAGPEPVRRGAYVTVKGRLMRQQLAPGSGATYAAYSSQPVQLQRRTLDGSYRYVRTVRSNRTGYVTTRLKALPEDRCYRFVFRGADTTKAVTASGDCVHVRR